MAGFVQIIEFKTSRIDEIEALAQERQAQVRARGMACRATITADRDRPGYYLRIIEFDSYESAMASSGLPETSELATKVAKLCDEPPNFYNLDVLETRAPTP